MNPRPTAPEAAALSTELRARAEAYSSTVSAAETFSDRTEKANAHPIAHAAEAFLLTKRIAGCTQATLHTYRWWLERFAAFTESPTALEVQKFFVTLQHLSPSRPHQAYRTLRTFLRWCVETRLLTENPLRFSMRTPKTLPNVPTEDELRAGELLHLLVEDRRPADRGMFVRAGKGRKDRVAFIGPTTTRAIKVWLARHPLPNRSCSVTARVDH